MKNKFTEKLNIEKFIDCVLYLNRMEIAVKNYSIDTLNASQGLSKNDCIKLSAEDYELFCHNLVRMEEQKLLVNRHDSGFVVHGHDPISYLKNLLLNRNCLTINVESA